MATLLVKNGMALDEVSRYLGHSSTAPTRRYAVHRADPSGIEPPKRWSGQGWYRNEDG